MSRIPSALLFAAFLTLLTLHPSAEMSAQDVEAKASKPEKATAKKLAKGQLAKGGHLDEAFWKLYDQASEAIDVKYGDGVNFDKRVAAPQEFEIPLVADFIDRPVETFEATAQAALGTSSDDNLLQLIGAELDPSGENKVLTFSEYFESARQQVFPTVRDLDFNAVWETLFPKRTKALNVVPGADLQRFKEALIVLGAADIRLRDAWDAVDKTNITFRSKITALAQSLIGQGKGISKAEQIGVTKAFLSSEGSEVDLKAFVTLRSALTKDRDACASAMSEIQEISTRLPRNALIRVKTLDSYVVIAGKGDHTHKLQGNESFVIDCGGNDTYTGIIATASPSHPLSLLYDGGGNDTYSQTKGKIGLCGAIGGFAELRDLGGDDRYEAGDISLGAGIFGFSELEDLDGEDTYVGGQFTQGAGYVGVGILKDVGSADKDGEDTTKKRSNDSYRCDRYGQGFGYVAGFGKLIDTGGNDRYDAGGRYRHMPLLPDSFQSLSQGFGFGSRGNNFAGGIGVLDDQGSGNDTYNAEVYGQGASYWYALGVLRDGGGNDRYTMTQYGQGAGIHLSGGMLIDEGGNDLYYNFNGVGTGGAHDYAVGFLVDKAGNDAYYSNGLAQGLNNSVAILYDAEGDDSYSSRAHNGIGFAHNLSIAMLIDGAGKDNYSIPIQNGVWRYRGETGVVVENIGPKDAALAEEAIKIWREVERAGKAEEEGAPKLVTKKPARPAPVVGADDKDRSAEDLAKLWAKAAEWQVGTEKNKLAITNARRTLVEEDNLDFLISKLDESYTLQLRALWSTIPHYGAAALPKLVEQLADPSKYWRFRNSVDLITRIYQRQARAEDASAAKHVEEITPKVLEAFKKLDESKRFGLLDFLNRYNSANAEAAPIVDLEELLTPYLWSKKDRTRLSAVKLAKKLPKTLSLAAQMEVIAATDEYHAVRVVASGFIFTPIEDHDLHEASVKVFKRKLSALLEERKLNELYLKRTNMARETALLVSPLVANNDRLDTVAHFIFASNPEVLKEGGIDDKFFQRINWRRIYRGLALIKGRKDLCSFEIWDDETTAEMLKDFENAIIGAKLPAAQIGVATETKHMVAEVFKANSIKR